MHRGYLKIPIRKLQENHSKTYENYSKTYKTIVKPKEINRKSIRGTLGFPYENYKKITGKHMKTIRRHMKTISKP